MKGKTQQDPNEPDYVHPSLDSKGADGEEVVPTTDLEAIADKMVQEESAPPAEDVLVEEVSLDPNKIDVVNPDDAKQTDVGGLVDREDVFDENSESLPAGAMGHWGIDDDTD